MAELKNMTVQALRDLARKALGRGHSRLKTKSELVAALQAAGRGLGTKVREATGRAAKAAERVVESGRARAKAAREKKPAAKAAAAKRAKAAKEPEVEPAKAEKVAAKPARREKEPRKARERRAAEVEPTEPDPESHFVARVAGESAVREAPHPMTESALEERAARAEAARRVARPQPEVDEGLGELPWTYGDDALVALPRDPRTLYVYWDHHGETLKNGFSGLEGAHAQIWVFGRRPDGGWDRVRTVDFALESRSYFIHDLEPGRVYRAEIHLLDRAGRQRRLQEPSNEMQLPPFGPSPVVDDRFMRIAWGTPLARLLQHYREGAPFPEELRAILAHLSDWSRFVGPTWGSGSGGLGAAGGPGGRPSGPSGEGHFGSSPSSPWGPWGPSGGGRSGEGA
jgi:hypothetical protein